MDKPNVFRSSSFHMADGDVLHLLFDDETGSECDVRLMSGGSTANSAEVPDAPTAYEESDATSTSFTANWSLIENASGYYLDVATDEGFTAFVAGYEDLDVGYVNEYSVVGLVGTYTYYYRLRAYNEIGTSDNSNTISATTLDEVVTDFDGNIYTYVTIGTQQWLVENLITTHYRDGTAIPNLILDADWIAEDGTPGHDGGYCWYNNDAVTYADYGCLYNWYAVDNAHELAPTGWRVPSATDWDILVAYIGAYATSGGLLKEIGTTHWLTPNTGATDEYDFTALGGGHRVGADGSFEAIQEAAEFFKTDEVGINDAEVINLSYIDVVIIDSDDNKTQGLSIRCVRDV